MAAGVENERRPSFNNVEDEVDAAAVALVEEEAEAAAVEAAA